MDTQTIKNTCEQIRKELNKGKDRQTILKHFSDFHRQYPKLFDACLNHDFPLEYLDYMLEMKNQLSESSLSIDEADKLVYNKLQEKYVLPVMPPTKQ